MNGGLSGYFLIVEKGERVSEECSAFIGGIAEESFGVDGFPCFLVFDDVAVVEVTVEGGWGVGGIE